MWCVTHLAIGDVYAEVYVTEAPGSDLPHKPVLSPDDELALVDYPDDRHGCCVQEREGDKQG